MILLIAWTTFAAAALPLVMLIMNRGVFRRAPMLVPTETLPRLSVLIPARNEAQGIEVACRAVLANQQVDLELIVMDDQSTDGTDQIVQRLAEADPRVRLAKSVDLPEGWAGKQHACYQLAQLATHDLLVWIDADVRLAPDALSRLAQFQKQSQADLVSGFPRQETHSLAERLVVPLINFILLGYLPMAMMRASRSPGFGAACGQWIAATRAGYEQTGGHSNPLVRGSFHDGVKMPRAFREAGLATDVFDATDTATCRMYRSLPEVWFGFAKNATEGIATPVGLWVWSGLLMLGHVAPWLLLIDLPWLHPAVYGAVVSAAAMSLITSLWVAFWFKQGLVAALLRPFGITLFLTIQWYAYARRLLGKAPTWRGRSVSA